MCIRDRDIRQPTEGEIRLFGISANRSVPKRVSSDAKFASMSTKYGGTVKEKSLKIHIKKKDDEANADAKKEEKQAADKIIQEQPVQQNNNGQQKEENGPSFFEPLI
eukprot:TRINITY_DN4202_c0_g1_i2.p1 TRINITY_DN4202_c0_g1~~TRINITY_DN4202_c0_g1_i2.p1  ORF type:complete len:107 (+),score=42.05 TRINITY_DN4202_c0_g1_i2:1-321(+)